MKTIVALPDAKKALKALGYRLTTKRGSEFVSAKVVHVVTGEQVSGFNCMTPETYAAHRAYFEYVKSVSIRDGDWRVIC